MPVMFDVNCLTAPIPKFEPIGSGSEASCAEPPAADIMSPAPDRSAARNARHALPRRHSAAQLREQQQPTRRVSSTRIGVAQRTASALRGSGA